MKSISKYISIVLSLLVFNANGEELKFSLGDSEDGLEAAKIISKRLNQARSFFDSEVEYTEENSIAYLVVETKIVKSNYFEYLTTAQGQLEAFTGSGSNRNIWFTDEDIENTGSNDGSVDIRVTEAAAHKIDNLYKENMGELLTILLDGKVILKAKITRPLGNSFRLRTGSSFDHDAEYIAILLKHGSLEKAVSLERVEP